MTTKPFVFKLQSVLDLRARVEEQARGRYAEALRLEARAQGELIAAQNALENFNQQLAARRGTGFRASDHQLFWSAIHQQKEICVRREKALSEALTEAAQKRSELLQARKEREMLSRLKNNQQAAHAQAAISAEAALVDDFIVSRHGFKLREEALLQ